tara:strand:+ start:229 stop:474 length:246 start_codon:yes stop_codon:yes gene_type:complete
MKGTAVPESALTTLAKGDKAHVHVSLYQRHLTILDDAAARYACSRAEFIEALLDDYDRGLVKDLAVEIEPGRSRAKKGTTE